MNRPAGDTNTVPEGAAGLGVLSGDATGGAARVTRVHVWAASLRTMSAGPAERTPSPSPAKRTAPSLCASRHRPEVSSGGRAAHADRDLREPRERILLVPDTRCPYLTLTGDLGFASRCRRHPCRAAHRLRGRRPPRGVRRTALIPKSAFARTPWPRDATAHRGDEPPAPLLERVAAGEDGLLGARCCPPASRRAVDLSSPVVDGVQSRARRR